MLQGDPPYVLSVRKFCGTQSLKEFSHDKENIVSLEQTVISCTTELRHSVTALYFDTSEKYDKVFCLPSEASHFSSNKQFAAKSLIRAISENILFCQQIMQHLPGNLSCPISSSRPTTENNL